VLRGAPGESGAVAQRQRRVRAREVLQRDPAAARERQIGGVAETATEPEAERQRQPPEDGDEDARG
jgi:hypothetical protein